MSLVKRVEIAAPWGGEGVRVTLTGSKRHGYQIEAIVLYESVYSELVVSEQQRQDLIALLAAAAPRESASDRAK